MFRGTGWTRRTSWLLAAAWGSTLLPLAFFVYFTVETYGLRERAVEAEKRAHEAESRAATADAKFAAVSAQIEGLSSKKTELEAAIKQLDDELTEKAASNAHYRKLAGIRVRYYRASDEARAARVAARLGLDRAELGQSRTLGIEPNALAYGSEISESDLQEIALAFLAEGFPLRKLTPATAVRDAKLIQVIASADAARSCQLLKEAEIKAGVRCGPPVRAPLE